MREEYTDEQINKMMQNILSDERLKNKMLKDFGFDVKEYEEDELAYILCAITEQGGLKDKVKAAKALYIVDQISKFVTMHNDYESVGDFTVDILADCGVIQFDNEPQQYS